MGTVTQIHGSVQTKRRSGKSGPPRYEQPADVIDLRSLEIEAQARGVAEEWIVTLKGKVAELALRLSAMPASEVVASDLDVAIYDVVRDAQLTVQAMGTARRMRNGWRNKLRMVEAG